MALIAIVEDEDSQRRLLQALLQNRNHDVVAFSNGEEALAAIDETFALVVTDVVMPKLNGVRLCAALRERFTKTALPIIVMSALDEEQTIAEALEAGASDYISKPYPPGLVQAKVKIHLADRLRSASTRRDSPTPKTFSSDLDRPSSFPSRYGHYILEGVLGRGAYGVVYQARSGDDAVALKILDRSLSENRRELSRYLREVATLEAVSCETVVRFVGAGHDEGRYYLAMESLSGRSTSECLLTDGALTLAQVLRIGQDISHALNAIHGQGLVHRDVKPANVVLCEGGDAKLVDFGLAKLNTHDPVTSSDELMGTVGYIAPEVVRGEEANASSDLYSLGITLYELYSAQRAFTAKNALEVLKRVTSGYPVTPLSLAVPGTPAEVAALIAELMAFDPEERLSDAAVSERRFKELRATHG